MSTSLKIAKAELRSLFYSPIAWFLTIIFIFQSALSYTSLLEQSLTKQQLGGGYLESLGYLTNNVFGIYGLYGDMVKKVFLYLPLLTMGLISRETGSGTIKLLYSSPIKARHIVAGKFIAMAGYSFLLVLLLAIYAGTGMVVIQSVNTAAMVSGLIGVFLLLCTYSAIGLFMSCLTTYQVVAALSTLVAFAFFNYIGNVWQDVDFVRSLTYFLSISGRTDHMIVGLISSKDVIYFLVIMAMFLAFSLFRLQGERVAVSGARIALKYTLTFIGALVIGYVSNIPRFIVSYDGTATKVFTLNANTMKLVRQLGDEPLEVTSYINLLDNFIWNGLPDLRNADLDRWEPYLRAKHNITLKYVYYYDSPGRELELMRIKPGETLRQTAENSAKSFHLNLDDFKSPEEIRKIVDLRPEGNRYVIQLKYKDRSTFLRLFNDQTVFPSETEVAAALKRLTVPLPKIVFVESEFERGRNPMGERDYGILTNRISRRISLINQGFDTKSISIKDQEIPPNTAVLVIAGPLADFTAGGMARIQKYIDDGGNLLIAGEPGKQAVLNPLIKSLGVQLMDGQLVENDDLLNAGKPREQLQEPTMGTVGMQADGQATGQNNGLPYDLVKPALTQAAAGNSWYFEEPFKKGLVVSMKGAAALSYVSNGPFAVKPILMTDERVSWIKKGKLVADSGAVVYSQADGDLKGSYVTLLALTRQVKDREQRIIVSGNADFLSNGGLYRRIDRDQANTDVGIGLFSWFTYGQFPVDTRHTPMKDDRLHLTSPGLKALKIAYMGVLPGLLLISAGVFLVRRNRK
jgi:ABC-2 type transport system permease protein